MADLKIVNCESTVKPQEYQVTSFAEVFQVKDPLIHKYKQDFNPDNFHTTTLSRIQKRVGELPNISFNGLLFPYIDLPGIQIYRHQDLLDLNKFMAENMYRVHSIERLELLAGTVDMTSEQMILVLSLPVKELFFHDLKPFKTFQNLICDFILYTREIKSYGISSIKSDSLLERIRECTRGQNQVLQSMHLDILGLKHEDIEDFREFYPKLQTILNAQDSEELTFF